MPLIRFVVGNRNIPFEPDYEQAIYEQELSAIAYGVARDLMSVYWYCPSLKADIIKYQKIGATHAFQSRYWMGMRE